jgi:GH43 family beta-xylosidase
LYTNPVYPHYFADPFVLRHEGRYYAYGTAPGSADGEIFPILVSDDLVQWTFGAWALKPRLGIEFWAPEVAYHDGRFYMYYSIRGIEGRNHQLTVAVNTSPLGPFEETGRVLVPDQPFSIDAHPFRDQDGQWYLYYAQDFLNLEDDHRIGTGIVVDRLTDMQTLAGAARVVVRPHADWQIFKAQREIYDAVYDWHTVEGPSVLRYQDRIYCFYSGGAWELENYGVAYVAADHPMGVYHRPAENRVPILKSVPGKVIGPGHNSFTQSPSGQTMIVYHAWDAAMTMRRMCIDPLRWQDGEPVIDGPTWTPQP